jgi:hypothetical protein
MKDWSPTLHDSILSHPHCYLCCPDWVNVSQCSSKDCMVRKLTSQFRHFYAENEKDRIQIDVDKKNTCHVWRLFLHS